MISSVVAKCVSYLATVYQKNYWMRVVTRKFNAVFCCWHQLRYTNTHSHTPRHCHKYYYIIYQQLCIPSLQDKYCVECQNLSYGCCICKEDHHSSV